MSDTERPTPPFKGQQQDQTPGRTAEMNPQPDHGEKSYKARDASQGRPPSSLAATVALAARSPSHSPVKARTY